MLSRGLIILLISKAAASSLKEKEQSKQVLISQRQRSLAEITEMIHTAYMIHKGIINVSELQVSDSTSIQDLEFGNKIAILSGDYILANACVALSSLRNTKVVELISNAIRDFTESEFFEKQDKDGKELSSAELSVERWTNKQFLSSGSLLANGCQGALELANHLEEKQMKAFEVGKQIALAWQIFLELQPFTNTSVYTAGTAFDISSLPVILHFEQNKKDLKDFVCQGDNMNELDYKKIHSAVCNGNGVIRAKQLGQIHAQKSLNALDQFEDSEAQQALKNIVHSFQD